MATDQEHYLAVLKASYDYDPQPDAEDELAIKQDQLLFLLERIDEDWWKVKVKADTQEEDGASGLVPSAYVEAAEPTSVVKVLYDYEAAQLTELTVKEDEILNVYVKDDDWFLVQNLFILSLQTTGSNETPAPASTSSISQIVVPDSPPRARPASTYVDPADRVAAAPMKTQADSIQTWAVSEVDKKGKKKKGTLGVGNGAMFFASESDKTPVQQWKTSDIQSVKIEKSKHVHIEVGGADAISLHYHAGGKDTAEAIVAKLESSRSISGTSTSPSLLRRSPPSVRAAALRNKDEVEEQETPIHVDPADGEAAVVLYDFTADGEDELTVHEEEHLIVLERDNDEWWKCRNATGAEGVVPASYVELVSGGHAGASAAVVIADHTEDASAIATRAAEEAEKRAEAQRREEARTKAERDREEKEREKERKKMEAEQRAKAAAAAAEADRKRREREREKQKEKERAAAEEEAQRKNQAQRESAESSGQPSRSRPNRDSSSGAGRSSTDSRRGPPSENLREWHDRTGQFRVDAAFLGFANGKLRLHKVNGVVIEVPSEKMSAEDMRYVEKLTAKKSSPPRKSSDDDEPLELRRRSLVPEAARSSASKPPQKKGPSIDWFEFFLNAGCDVDDCTRYASSFERDKIDEALLPDITESTMRSLGLREGDIIRVKKAIDQRQPKGGSSNNDQLHRDEELARQLQAEETGGSTRQPARIYSLAPTGR
ncbi:Actin cytoskeleton-regulatory complex protein sla1 [Grifola frondosa]|uniref:Actin cytoskeleton-regulatory complex protein SLA1 n=1 Tax=Grifola frondosa TaxID=5627 RepID=A0A1C7MJW5_GRIFR|nr:Actin cytoskeleton-regulatory complex protein sla1 [Grifola frondosa]